MRVVNNVEASIAAFIFILELIMDYSLQIALLYQHLLHSTFSSLVLTLSIHDQASHALQGDIIF